MNARDFGANRAHFSELEWIFSNRLELLAHALADKWQKQPGLWLERRVVVPNQAIGHWLQHHLATRLGVCTGMRWWTPRSLALELQRDRQIKNGPVLPSKEELHLALYSLIVEKLSSKKSCEDALWLPLKSAFSSANGHGLLHERRLSHFCALLTEIFERYSEFGAFAVRKWEKDRLASAENWQAFLWRSLFGKGGPWCSLCTLCDHLKEELNFDFLRERGQQELDVFALRHLSNAHWRLLQRASTKMRVRLFALSPCRYYWTDVRSSREQKRFLRWIAAKGAKASTLEAFESSLRQSHPLLANLGKVGRRFVEKSEIGNCSITECYALPADLARQKRYSELWQQDIIKVGGKKTLLSQLQADLLFMRPFESENSPPESVDCGDNRLDCDGTIEVHCASSPIREMEIAKALIHQTLQADQSLAPSDILLLAPDLAEYEALAASAFEQDAFGLQLKSLESTSSRFGGFWQSMSSLLSVAESGFDAEDICKALINPMIQKSIGLSFKESALLIKRVKESGVDWGLDQEHRLQCLTNVQGISNDHRSARGTWQEFHTSLLGGLAFSASLSSTFQSLLDPTKKRFQQVEDRASTAQMLEKWLCWFELAKSHLYPIAAQEKMALGRWMQLLTRAADALLSACPEGDSERLSLLSWCRSWGKRVEDHPILTNSIEKTLLSWSFVKDLLKNRMGQMGKARSFRKQGVRLASLPSGVIPSRVIIVLGMSEGILPRAQVRQPFELTAAEGMEYAPSSGDWDRCFFLEILLAARDKLFLTYCAAQREDPAETQEPSFLVSELLSTLGQMVENRSMRHPTSLFDLSKDQRLRTCHFSHPQAGWDVGYFAPNSPLSSLDQHQFRCALSSQKALPLPLGARLHGIYPEKKQRAESTSFLPSSVTFSLRQVAKALAHPLEFHLQERLRISFWKELRQDQRWLLNKWQRQKLQKLRLSSAVATSSFCDNRSHLIAHANYQRLNEESQSISSLLDDNQASLQLVLTGGIDRFYRLDGSTWLMPAKVNELDQIQVKIEGQFNDNQLLGRWGLALIDFEKEVKLTNLCRHWPHIAAFCQAQPFIEVDRHIFIGQNKVWQPQLPPQEIVWSALSRFALAAYRMPLPLLPDWFDSYERADKRELEERFYAELAKPIPDVPQTLKWIFGERVDSSLFDFWIDSYHAHWRSDIEPVYSCLKQQIDQMSQTSQSRDSKNRPFTSAP